MNPVRELRRSAGVSQRELAERAGTSQPTVASYESGTRSPTWRTVQRMSESVGLSPFVLYSAPMTREERRSLALHEVVAARVEENPEVLARARGALRRLKASHPHVVLFDAWDHLLRLPPSFVADVLRDPRPFARELRHVTPFVGVLSAAERAEVYQRFRRAERGAA